jgi:hypothetical protein
VASTGCGYRMRPRYGRASFGARPLRCSTALWCDRRLHTEEQIDPADARDLGVLEEELACDEPLGIDAAPVHDLVEHLARCGVDEGKDLADAD